MLEYRVICYRNAIKYGEETFLEGDDLESKISQFIKSVMLTLMKRDITVEIYKFIQEPPITIKFNAGNTSNDELNRLVSDNVNSVLEVYDIIEGEPNV